MKGPLFHELVKIEAIKIHADEKGINVTVFVSNCMKTLLKYLQKTFPSAEYWDGVHESGMRTWSNKEDQGLLLQSLGYAQKISSYIMLTVKKCLVLSIKFNGLELNDQQKNELGDMLDKVLNDLIE